jgi:hypothetical protein
LPQIIDEDTFKTSNPLTYDYLLKQKTELLARDKGTKTYPAWYAYGRSQAIKYSEKECIFIPCFLDPKCIEKNIFTNKNVLHYSCLCIEPHDAMQINKIISCIINNIDFIKDNSPKRSAGWINMSSRILYQIPLN